MKMKDFYQALGITKEAAPYEIKQAYYKLSRENHPDRGGCHERMQLLNEAYEMLSDPVKKRMYDANWDAVADIDNDSNVKIEGYLGKGHTPPYSYSFRKEHESFIKQYTRTPLKPFSSKEKEGAQTSNLYCIPNPDNKTKMVYFNVFAFLIAKKSHAQTNVAAIPKESLTPRQAVQLLMDFLAGRYYGQRLTELLTYFSSSLNQKTQEPSISEFYKSIYEIISLTEKPISERQGLIFSIKRITDFAKQAPDTLLPHLLPLFYNPYFRFLFKYALTVYWDDKDNLFSPETIKQFNGADEAKQLMDVLKDQLYYDNKNKELSNSIRRVKLLHLFEKDKQHDATNTKQANEYRKSAFHCMDWIPALLETKTQEILANTLLQIGTQFQKAAQLESTPAVKMADEQLALELYISAVGIASRCNPDVEIYINTMIIKCLSAFAYQNESFQEIFMALKKCTLNTVDVFPVFESPKSNLSFLKEGNNGLHLMRRLLHAMIAVYEHNKSHSPGIPLEHPPSTVLYQAYVACLNNWYQDSYNPDLENKFRLDLMDELLFDKSWTFLDVEQNVTSPWIMVDRDANGWMQSTRLLPYPEDNNLQVYRCINGVEVNTDTGNIQFYLTPWTKNRPGYEKSFTLFDLQEMLEKNIGSAIFSLDPADPDKPYHPFNQMRLGPNQLFNSELLNTMLLTDYILKFLTTGQEVQGHYPFERKPVNSMIQHLPAYLQEIIKEYQSAPHYGTLHRFWIEAEEVDVTSNDQEKDNTIRIGLDKIRMVVKKHRMTRNIHGELNDDSNDDEGWPIYVLTPKQLDELRKGIRTIDGHAMIFIYGVAELLYWENNNIVQTYYPNINNRELLIRLYTQKRDETGKVLVSSANMPLIYRAITTMASQSGMSHRYSPEFIFTHKFTTHYDEFAQYIPEFGRLKELSKITVLVHYLNGIYQSNKQSIEALSYLINPSSTPPPSNQEILKVYQKQQEEIQLNIVSLFGVWRSQLTSVESWREKLDVLRKEIGSLHFDEYSPEVRDACDRWYADLARNNPHASYRRIWDEIINPKKTEIAKQLTDAKRKNYYQQVYDLFLQRCRYLKPDYYGTLISSFLNWDNFPLAFALAEEERYEVQNKILEVLPGNTLNDIGDALDNNAESIKRIGQKQSLSQFQERKKKDMVLTEGFATIHFAEDEKQEINLKEECLWIPASVRHEVKKDNSTGHNRHSFFVYGGVNIQPRVNVTQGNGPLGGNPVGGGSFNRTTTLKGFQDHHIASNINKLTKNHEAFTLSGMNMNSRANKIYLPSDPSLHATRSIHQGRHTNSYSINVAGRLNGVVEQGKAQGWTQEQYRAATRAELSNLRQELRAGNIGLNKNHRTWATKW